MFGIKCCLACCISLSHLAAAYVEINRSPVDLALSHDESWIATVNQTSNSVSIVRTADGVVLDELSVGARPSAIALHPNTNELFVTSSYGFALHRIEVVESKLRKTDDIPLGSQANGLAISSDGSTAYVALTDTDEIAVCDLESHKITSRIPVGRWPRYVALSEDGKRLAVGTSGDRGISIVDLQREQLIHVDRFVGLNIGHLKLAKNAKQVYFPWMVYRRNPINPRNIQIGWVLASRLGRIGFEDDSRREAISLDPAGRAVADPHGIDLTSDENHVVISASGSQELLVLRNNDLPFLDRGSTDHIDDALLKDSERFFRIELGGRPMGIRVSQDNRTVFVANYMNNSIQVVDLVERKILRNIELGSESTPSLARKGEAIFYDARRSLDQWYSCHSCHYEGGTNSVIMDTVNDGSSFTFKTVLPLYQLDKTGPWTWHGWQKKLKDAMTHSLKTTMQGPEPNSGDEEALIAFFSSLTTPPRPNRNSDPIQLVAIERGKQIFDSSKGACTTCHRGDQFSDGEIHDVGTGDRNDAYVGFNTPTLNGVFRKVQLLHDGSAENLQEALTGPHAPEKIAGSELTDSELKDLISYLKSL